VASSFCRLLREPGACQHSTVAGVRKVAT
jgi:hypothetical protein